MKINRTPIQPLVFIQTTTSAHTGPKIEIKEAHHDLGKVMQGQKAIHTFEVRNIGDEVLEILKIQTS